MKKLFSLGFFALVFTLSHAQTNVSGGVYTNTTWTLANSPYIVVDTVRVFSGVTLTIEPGVVVKFNNDQLLEITSGAIIANGTAADSITFTSNSAAPTPGIYKGVSVTGSMISQFSYCNFYYATTGLDAEYSYTYSVSHCKIMHNINGITGIGSAHLDSSDIEYNSSLGVNGFHDITNCTISNNGDGIASSVNINNCVIDYNSGVGVGYPGKNVLNCFIRYNQIGIDHCNGNPGIISNCVITNNQYGIHNPERDERITNCVIDSNSTGIFVHYNIGNEGNNIFDSCRIEYNITGIDDGNNDDKNYFTKNIIDNNVTGIILSSADSFYCNRICNNSSYALIGGYVNVANNYWCTPDSASTEVVIYDGYDNINYGLVSFIPLDSTCFPVLTTPVAENENKNSSFTIYPNPTYSSFSISRKGFYNENCLLQILNSLGDIVYSKTVSGNGEEIINPGLTSGFYFVQVIAPSEITTRKLIVE